MKYLITLKREARKISSIKNSETSATKHRMRQNSSENTHHPVLNQNYLTTTPLKERTLFRNTLYNIRV